MYAFNEIMKTYHFYDGVKDASVETFKNQADQVEFVYNHRGSDDMMKKMLFGVTEVEFCGQIPQNNQSWGYVVMFEKDYNDFKTTRCLRTSGYSHTVVHQMPDMAMKFGFLM